MAVSYKYVYTRLIVTVFLCTLFVHLKWLEIIKKIHDMDMTAKDNLVTDESTVWLPCPAFGQVKESKLCFQRQSTISRFICGTTPLPLILSFLWLFLLLTQCTNFKPPAPTLHISIYCYLYPHWLLLMLLLLLLLFILSLLLFLFVFFIIILFMVVNQLLAQSCFFFFFAHFFFFGNERLYERGEHCQKSEN